MEHARRTRRRGARPGRSFGQGWITDTVEQLELKDVKTTTTEYARLPDLSKVDFDRDVLFTWNGTTWGVRMPNGDWIPAGRLA